jgi:SAM-dependent methyltransferase
MSLLEAILASVEPHTVLDVGCGCGDLAKSLRADRTRVVAIDPDLSLAPRWRDRRDGSTVQFCCMDGRFLAFADNTFSLVFERDALHHTRDWTQVIDEMVRVSSKHLLIEEPIDDLRSIEKRNTFMAQALLLELQREVGFPHYQHLSSADLLSYVQTRATVTGIRTERSDARIPFEEFFASFDHFVAQSDRTTYWRNRLRAFRSSLATSEFCDDDRFLLVATKGRACA